MMTPVFSVIVPVYKVESYLDKCVQSLMNQTYPNIEIILVDDGSPDRCPEMCDAYARCDARIKVIHKANGGLSDARNAGMDAAAGEYLLFVDSDDYIALDACERLLPFTLMDCDVIVADGIAEGAVKQFCHGNFAPGKVCDGKDYLKISCRNGRMPMAAVLYLVNRAFMKTNAIRFKKGITHEDEEFTPRLFLSAKRIVESGVCFYHYVIRDGSITTRKDLRKNATDFYGTCVALQKIYEDLDDRELQSLLTDSLVCKYLSLFQQGKLYQYGKDHLHKDFIWENARFLKTRCKALLYCVSPRLYWHINFLAKMRK